MISQPSSFQLTRELSHHLTDPFLKKIVDFTSSKNTSTVTSSFTSALVRRLRKLITTGCHTDLGALSFVTLRIKCGMGSPYSQSIGLTPFSFLSVENCDQIIGLKFARQFEKGLVPMPYLVSVV
eukprot:sb/3475761/